MGGLPSAIADHNMDGSGDAQPSIDVEEDYIESPGVDDEDELSTNQIRASKKVNSIATIEALRLKPSSLSYMQVPCIEWFQCQLRDLHYPQTWHHLRMNLYMVTKKRQLYFIYPSPMKVARLRR